MEHPAESVQRDLLYSCAGYDLFGALVINVASRAIQLRKSEAGLDRLEACGSSKVESLVAPPKARGQARVWRIQFATLRSAGRIALVA